MAAARTTPRKEGRLRWRLTSLQAGARPFVILSLVSESSIRKGQTLIDWISINWFHRLPAVWERSALHRTRQNWASVVSLRLAQGADQVGATVEDVAGGCIGNLL